MCTLPWLTGVAPCHNRMMQFERYEDGSILLYHRIYYKNNDYRTHGAPQNHFSCRFGHVYIMNTISAHLIAFIRRILETPPTNQPRYHYQTTKPLKCSNFRFCSGSNMQSIVLFAFWRIKWMKPNAQARAFPPDRITINKCDTANMSTSTVFTYIYKTFSMGFSVIVFEHLATSLCLSMVHNSF